MTEDDATPTLDAVFKVSAKLRPCKPRQSQSCWSSLLGPAVVVYGFPVTKRPDGARGLETSVPAMAAMAGLTHALSFENGFLFKGRSHALVPVQEVGSSLQWHMLDTYPEKLDWDQIRKHCPTRVKGRFKAFSGYRSFVGWSPDALDFLGTPYPRSLGLML